jgi:glutathione S-transferase
MSLTLFYHPLASFCWKVQIALYENDTPFTSSIVNLGDKASSAQFFSLAPMGKMPVLRDEQRNRTVPETSIIIEYLDRHHPGQRRMLPTDEELRLDARSWDRFFDLYVQVPMQKIVADHRRPSGEKDPAGVTDATATLRKAYDVLEQHLPGRTWVVGDEFSIADAAASPALFYSSMVVPFAETHAHVTKYFDRLVERAAFKRVIREAQPYFQYYPFRERIPARFL